MSRHSFSGINGASRVDIGWALASNGQKQQTGAALGLRNAASRLGQAAGAGLGGLLFALQMTAAYSITGAILVAMGIASGRVAQRGNDASSGEQFLGGR